MPLASRSRNYTKREAALCTWAPINLNAVRSENMRSIELNLGMFKWYNVEPPKLPEGFGEFSVEAAAFYEKEHKKVAADYHGRRARQALAKRLADEAVTEARRNARKAATDAAHRSAKAAAGSGRVRKPKVGAGRVSNGPAKANEFPAPAAVDNGVRVANINGRKVVCDEDDEDERQLIIQAEAAQKARKRRMDEIEAGAAEEDRHRDKRRCVEPEAVRPPVIEESVSSEGTKDAKKTQDTPNKSRGRLIQVGGKAVNAIGKPMLAPKAPSERIRVVRDKKTGVQLYPYAPLAPEILNVKIPKRQTASPVLPPTNSDASRSAPSSAEDGPFKRGNGKQTTRSMTTTLGRRLGAIQSDTKKVSSAAKKASSRTKRATSSGPDSSLALPIKNGAGAKTPRREE